MTQTTTGAGGTHAPKATDLLAVRSRVSWAAIAAGAMIALAIYFVLTLLGIALGIELAVRGNDANLGRFDRFGYLLGLAFQITDDVLNLNGTATRYGKEIEGDLWEGKRTLVISHALTHANAGDGRWIADFLSRPRERRLPREVLRLHDMLERTGSIRWAQRSATAFAEEAAREFDAAAFADVPASADLDWLRSCVNFLVQRDS